MLRYHYPDDCQDRKVNIIVKHDGMDVVVI